jgi:hypothetical protein
MATFKQWRQSRKHHDDLRNDRFLDWPFEGPGYSYRPTGVIQR